MPPGTKGKKRVTDIKTNGGHWENPDILKRYTNYLITDHEQVWWPRTDIFFETVRIQGKNRTMQECNSHIWHHMLV